MNKTECKNFMKNEITGRWPEYPMTGALAEDLITILEPFTYEQAKQAARELRKQNGYNKLDIGELEKQCRQSRQQKESIQQVFVYVIFPQAKKKHEFWIPCKTPVDFSNQQESEKFLRYVHNLVYNYQETYKILDDPEIYVGEENIRTAQKRFYSEIMGIKAKGTWKETLESLTNKFAVPF